MTDSDVDPAIVAAALDLVNRARHDGIPDRVVINAARMKLRPTYTAAVNYAIDAGWLNDIVESIVNPDDADTSADTSPIATHERPGYVGGYVADT